MSYSTQGASNRQIYDCCAYAQALQQSVDPLQYDLYFGAVENCNKCIDKKAWFRQDKEIVDIESELWNITRPLTKCDAYVYNPNCKTGPNCISTFDPNAPRILSPSLCPIVYNNIPIQTNPGYNVPDPANVCLTKNDYREADKVNTFEQWVQGNKSILGNNSDPQNVFMFMNACANKPLYQGESEKVNPYMLNVYDSAPVSVPSPQGIPFPRMGYNLDERVPIPPTNVTNNISQLGMESQRAMFNSEMIPPQYNESILNAQREMPRGSRFPTMSTKGKLGNNIQNVLNKSHDDYNSDNITEQLFDNDSNYDSDSY